VIRNAPILAETLHSGEAGFTLLELLIAITILSFLIGLLSGGLTFALKLWERTTSTANQHETISATQQFLRQQLTAIYPVWQRDGGQEGHIKFDGGSDQLTFVSIPPEPISPASNQTFGLSLTNDGHLRLVWQSDFVVGSYPTAVNLLLGGIKKIEFSYYGADNGKGISYWRPQWRNARTLPQLIRLKLLFKDTDRSLWPELVIHPRVDVDTSCVYDSVSHGCMGR